jgi:DNA-binding transcriptional LysR family regulator
MDRLQSMRVFERVVDEGGFAAAARKMELAPAAVTRLIEDLEQSLGVRLLHRTTRRISLTQAGEAYLSRLRSILAEIDEAQEVVKAHSSEMSGTLRLLTTSSAAVSLVAPSVAHFQRRHPDVLVEIHASDLPAQHLDQFDLTILRQDTELDADVIIRPVLVTDYVVCGSPAYLQVHGMPRAPEDLSQHRMVRLRAPGTRLRALRFVNPAEGGRSVEVAPASAVVSNDSETTYQAALSGAGLTMLSERALAARTHDGQMQRVLVPWVSADPLRLVAAMPSRRFVPLRTRAFLDFFIEYVQNAVQPRRARKAA